MLINVTISLKSISYDCFNRYLKHDFKMLVNIWWYRNIIWYCQNTLNFMCQMRNSLLFTIQWGSSNSYKVTSFQNSRQVPKDNNVFLDNFYNLLSFVLFLVYIPTSACVIQTICLFLRYLEWTWLVSWFGSPFTSLLKYYSNVISLNWFDRSVHSSNILYVY